MKVEYEQPGNSEGSRGPWGKKQEKKPRCPELLLISPVLLKDTKENQSANLEPLQISLINLQFKGANNYYSISVSIQ